MEDLMKQIERMERKMTERNFPGSVKEPVLIAIQLSKRAKEVATELETLLDKQATPREMVKAIQPIIRENLDTK